MCKNQLIMKRFWKGFWDKQEIGLHRSQKEDF